MARARPSLRSRLLLGAASLAVALAAAEGVLRAVAPSGGRALRALHEPQPDRPWLYRLRPGAEARLGVSDGVHYRINADGFRDRVYVRPKPDDVFRIAVVSLR